MRAEQANQGRFDPCLPCDILPLEGKNSLQDLLSLENSIEDWNVLFRSLQSDEQIMPGSASDPTPESKRSRPSRVSWENIDKSDLAPSIKEKVEEQMTTPRKYKLGKLLSSFTETGDGGILDLYELGKMPPNPSDASDEDIDALITFLARKWHSVGQNFMMIKDKFHLIGSDDQKNKEIVIQSLGEILEELNNTNIAVKLLSSRVGGSAEFSEYEEETVWEAIGRLQDADGEIDVMTERLGVY